MGNLPYNISTPILFQALAAAAHLVDMHFMLQKEVVARMAAAPGSRDYGRLSVMLQARCQVVPLLDVPPHAFRPPPKVDSAVVRLLPTAPQRPAITDPACFAALVKAVRAAPQTLRNSLQGHLDQQALAAAGLDPGLRAEQVPVDHWIRLANVVAETARPAT